MQTRRTRGLAVALLACALVTSACGLKPEVKDQLAQGGGAVGAGAVAGTGAEGGVEAGAEAGTDAVADAGTDAGTDAGAAGTDDAAAPADDAAGDAGGDAAAAGDSGSAGGGSTDAGTTAGGGGSTGSSSGGTKSGGGKAPASGGGSDSGSGDAEAAPVGPNSKIGVDDKKKELRISLHGPLTGAGVPQDSFKSGTPKYWKGKKVKGYTIVAEAFDDKYQPGPAVKACNARAKTDFLIIGGAGTDQIQACGRSSVLQRGNVPYLSAGVTENGLGGLKNYFATSLTYKQQGRLVVAMAKKGGYLAPKNGKGWAVVISNTPNFKDAEEGFVTALKAAGQKATIIRTPKQGADATSTANQLREGQFESVFFLGQPLFFIQLVGQVGCPAYCPQFAGPGVSMGTNSIGGPACQGSGNQYKGEFLSPGPGLDMAAKVAPGVTFKDDIEFGIYAAMQQLEQLLKTVPGDSFTREGFIKAVEGANFKSAILPAVSFKEGRFGGSAAYALKMVCGKGHKTNGMYK